VGSATKPPVSARASRGARPRPDGLGSETELPGELHDEGAVLQNREAAVHPGVPVIVVHDEQLAPRLILPAQAHVRTRHVVGP